MVLQSMVLLIKPASSQRRSSDNIML